MRVLNVAGRHDAAKDIAAYLSRGTVTKREGSSVYNKIFEFNAHLWGKQRRMVMTSVSGHLAQYEFAGAYRKWQGCHPSSLFYAPVSKECSGGVHIKIQETLEREVRFCDTLILWTDCDREGENVAFEIIRVCRAIKPNIRVYRARFPAITKQSIDRALQTLDEPDQAVSDAVDVRSELDLRIGAAFTRFQTLRLQKVFPNTLGNLLVTYGSCQFPTLGLVTERFLAIDRFKSEPYWKIRAIDDRDGIFVEFRWARVRLLEELPCRVLLDVCLAKAERATVERVTYELRIKWRPEPLNTIELEKQASQMLHLSAKETMRIAERLYSRGYISHPRTETNVFPEELDLRALVAQQIDDPKWGGFASDLLKRGINPSQGRKRDRAYPPIYPTKYTNDLKGNHARVYEFVVRHFLACLSRDALIRETTVGIDIAGEKFVADGLAIIAENYLDVYIYEKWKDKEIRSYQQGQVFRPTSVDMLQEETSPPSLLTEAELISLMDKHGIGTHTTRAYHIDAIVSRQYAVLTDDKYIMPSKLGIGLVMGYDNMGLGMSKPDMRADLERDLQLICQRQKDPELVLRDQIEKYRRVFQVAIERASLIDEALANYLDERPVHDVVVLTCPKCGSNMVPRERRQWQQASRGVGGGGSGGGGAKYIGCTGYPACRNVIWLPETVKNIQVSNETCIRCTEDIRKIKFQLVGTLLRMYGTSYTTCIGCDSTFNELLNIRQDFVKSTGRGRCLPLAKKL